MLVYQRVMVHHGEWLLLTELASGVFHGSIAGKSPKSAVMVTGKSSNHGDDRRVLL